MKFSLNIPRIVFLVLTTLFLYNSSVKAQAPLWQWAVTGGGSYISQDLSGNICTVGTYVDPFSSISEMYYEKRSPSGNLLDAGVAQGNGNVNGERIAGDQFGNVYVTGAFFGPLTFGIYTLSHSGFYIVKYDSSGTVVWANEVTTGYARTFALATDSTGHIYLAGTCNPGTMFGGITLTAGGLFRVVYDSLGVVVEAKNYLPQGYNISIEHMSFDHSRNLYVTGRITDPSGYIVVGLSATGPGLFVLKMDTSLNGIWVQGLQTLNTNANYTTADVISDGAGHVTISGYCTAGLIAGTDTLLEGSQRNQMFIAQLDDLGAFRWTHEVTCPGAINAYGISADSAGDIYFSGAFDSTSIRFDSVTLLNQVNSTADGFIAKYDSDGFIQWAKVIGGQGNDFPLTIIAGTNNMVYVSGVFYSTSLAFATVSGTTTLNNPTGDYTPFLAALSDVGTVDISEPKLSLSSGIQLFPNPTNSILSVYVRETFIDGNLILYNILGEEIIRKQLDATRCELRCEGLKEGVYVLTISKSGKTESKKVMIY
ncbi:MAG: T9SS type A sorting domain-containing protein [Bacteroidetes bacterium]|nr:T9SS type A sorting domain-containing protein [Bacteroidota bacterium]